MRSPTPLLFCAGAVFGMIFVAEAQQQGSLPGNPAGSMDPLIPAPADANVPTPNSTDFRGTLQTTTVQSTRPAHDPNRKVTADTYYDLLGTTGSYRVNTDRAKALQDEALQRARKRKQMKERMSSVRHYRLPSDSPSALGYLQDNPPAASEPPISRSSMTQSSPPPEEAVPANATYPGSESRETAAAPPEEEEIVYIKMPGSGGNLASRLMARRAANAPVEPAPDPSDAMVNAPTEVGNAPGPPQNVFRQQMTEETSSEDNPNFKEFFSRFKKNTPETPAPAPEPIEPSVSATMVTDAPLAPEYPDSDIPTFSTAPAEPNLADSGASDALVSPPEKKGFFSRFGKKKTPESTPEFTTPRMPSVTEADTTVAPPAFQPFAPSPEPQRPTITSIFRPDATAKKANAYSLVQGQEVFANVDGEEVKLTEGTRVRVLRTGTERSLVRLYDNRQATIANSALVPETE